MAAILSDLKVRNSTISAVVTRANGTVEDLGVISYRDSNPFKTFGWYLIHPEQWRHKARKFARSFAPW